MKSIGVKYGNKKKQTLSSLIHPLTMVGHFGNSVGKNCYPVSHIEMLKKKFCSSKPMDTKKFNFSVR
jgi:hypothetical protein